MTLSSSFTYMRLDNIIIQISVVFRLFLSPEGCHCLISVQAVQDLVSVPVSSSPDFQDLVLFLVSSSRPSVLVSVLASVLVSVLASLSLDLTLFSSSRWFWPICQLGSVVQPSKGGVFVFPFQTPARKYILQSIFIIRYILDHSNFSNKY